VFIDRDRRWLWFAAIALLFAAGGLIRVSPAAAQSLDQPPPSLVGAACPDGSSGTPPICFALTGDTSPLLTLVVLPAPQDAVEQDSNATVHGDGVVNPLDDTSGLPDPSQGAYR
jgi:hypothetical protein